uniref:Protein DPCD n=1 Tax=Trypanosoma vivax (strain Y486) TaxID=1055687 RepID=G0UCA7_TRYVY|nr:conserved hypothetical protein [Trypanosoma vivax Y486]
MLNLCRVVDLSGVEGREGGTPMGDSLAEPRTSVIVNGRKRITSKFTNGSELVEEYDVITDDLLLRKSRHKSAIGSYTEWQVEVGSEVRARNLDRELLLEAAGSPELVKQDAKDCYIFRIRNLPYPKEVFAVTVERGDAAEFGEIVVRTSNKKYFKRISIPDLERRRISLDPSHVSFDVQHNTLIIRYKKPLAALAAENAAKKERAALPAKRVSEEGSGNCQHQ